MTFKDVAIKNFKVNIKKYLTYYICNSFIVATFFMYSVLIFNEKLWETSQVEKGVNQVLVMPNVALSIFSLFFITYAHSSFIKWRKKEFGIFMNLGMTVGDIRKIIIYENVLVLLGSILVGIVIGLVFSRLFFIIITNLLGVTGISYVIGFKNFIFPIGIFTGIYLLNLLTTMIVTCRFNIINLLKDNRKVQSNRFSSPILAIIGLVIVIVFYVLLYVNFAVNSNVLLKATIMIFIGLYIFISQLGGFLIKYFKKRKNIYYKKLLVLTSLNNKFKETKKIIFIISILVAVEMFYVGFMLSFYITAEKKAVSENVYDIFYAELRDKNRINENKVNDIVSKNNEKTKEHKTLEFIFYYGTKDDSTEKIIMADKDINKVSDVKFNVNKGSYTFLRQYEKSSESEKKSFKSFNLKLSFDNGIYELTNDKNIFKDIFKSTNYQYNEIIVVNEDDYNYIKDKNKYYEIGKLQLYNFDNWKDTKNIVDKLSEELNILNKNTKPFKSEFLNEYGEKYLQVSSKISYYNYTKQGSSLLLSMSAYLVILFFIAIGIVLFLKLLSDIDIDKKRFDSMYRIGITEEEVKKQIGSELKALFFIGPVIGIILAFAYTVVFNQDGAQDLKKYFIYSNITVSVIFMIIQVIYYFICKRIYCNEILEEKFI